ncbi:adenosine-specific kinase [Patescibacteria group bacterium]|nr:adenosine-specific kinase [Patescibacteria group bacterium]MCL5091269.1 adenosine-specific kinase [Patescibacteria group bacterium]
MKTQIVQIKKPADVNFILAQSHFIKTVEDVYEVLVEAVPGIKFGLAFCEASGSRMVRVEGTDSEMVKLAVNNARSIGAGHALFIFMKNVFPINVLNRIKYISEIVHIYCATANPTQVIVAETNQGRGIMGVIDGGVPLGVENAGMKKARREFVRKIGYKL